MPRVKLTKTAVDALPTPLKTSSTGTAARQDSGWRWRRKVARSSSYCIEALDCVSASTPSALMAESHCTKRVPSLWKYLLHGPKDVIPRLKSRQLVADWLPIGWRISLRCTFQSASLRTTPLDKFHGCSVGKSSLTGAAVACMKLVSVKLSSSCSKLLR